MLSLLALSFLAPLGSSVDMHQCADVRAAQVDARVDDIGTSTRCGIGISIFGIDLSLGGPDCFPRRVVTPARQTCNGDYNEGTWCGFEQTLAVTAEKCECSEITLLGTGFKFPSCDCELEGNLGTVEDFGTYNCVPPHDPRPLPPRGGIGGLR